MKHRIALLLLLCLMLAVAPVLAESYTVTGLYTITVPEGFTLDNRTYFDEDGWLFMLTSDTALVEAWRDRTPYYDNLTMINPSPEDMSRFQSIFEDDFQDMSPSYVETVTTPDGVTFLIYTLKDTIGSYYNAETAFSGYGISFNVSYLDNATPDNALLLILKDLLQTLRPTEGGI